MGFPTARVDTPFSEDLPRAFFYSTERRRAHRLPVPVKALRAGDHVCSECNLAVEERLARQELSRSQVQQGDVHRCGPQVHRKATGLSPARKPEKLLLLTEGFHLPVPFAEDAGYPLQRRRVWKRRAYSRGCQGLGQALPVRALVLQRWRDQLQRHAPHGAGADGGGHVLVPKALLPGFRGKAFLWNGDGAICL